jgi:molybdenum-dependent DNA-binding transcriptional regulator ModE
MVGPVVRFRIDFTEHSSVGPGKIGLLEAIRDSGSLSQGARNIGMSYRRAWLLVESLKQSFLVTEFGSTLIKNFRELERDFATLAARRLQPITATVTRDSKFSTKVSLGKKLE